MIPIYPVHSVTISYLCGSIQDLFHSLRSCSKLKSVTRCLPDPLSEFIFATYILSLWICFEFLERCLHRYKSFDPATSHNISVFPRIIAVCLLLLLRFPDRTDSVSCSSLCYSWCITDGIWLHKLGKMIQLSDLPSCVFTHCDETSHQSLFDVEICLLDLLFQERILHSANVQLFFLS